MRPLQPQELSTPHAGGYGQHVEGFESVPVGCVEQLACLFHRERAHLFGGRSWGISHLRDVVRDHIPLHCLREGLVQDAVYLVDGRCGEPGIQAIAVVALYVQRGQLLQLDPAEDGLDVDPDEIAVPVEG
jgi:hypothetical protein